MRRPTGEDAIRAAALLLSIPLLLACLPLIAYDWIKERIMEVADLIDRPTCKIILARELRTAYGKPITGINGYILSCGHQAVGFEKPRYCPECGMEVGE